MGGKSRNLEEAFSCNPSQNQTAWTSNFMDCEGAKSARIFANSLSERGIDANLDCEKGIMRALMEHNHATKNLVSLEF